MTLGDRVALLRKGELQQVASPRELYEHPVNMFVAGFIGSPPMNFVPARVEGDTMHLPFVSFELPRALRDPVGDREWVMIGIRPERFEDVALLDGDKLTGGVEFEGRVDVVEWLGNEQYAYLPYDRPDVKVEGLEAVEDDLGGEAVQDQIVVALDPASRIANDTTARIWFDPSRLHVFDIESGDNLTVTVPASA
jgi:multiple sugar transport system ATP-binding protein